MGWLVGPRKYCGLHAQQGFGDGKVELDVGGRSGRLCGELGLFLHSQVLTNFLSLVESSGECFSEAINGGDGTCRSTVKGTRQSAIVSAAAFCLVGANPAFSVIALCAKLAFGNSTLVSHVLKTRCTFD